MVKIHVILIFTPCPTLLSIWEMEVAVTLSWVSVIGTSVNSPDHNWCDLLHQHLNNLNHDVIYLREVGTKLQRGRQEPMQRRCQGFRWGLQQRGRGLWTCCIGQICFRNMWHIEITMRTISLRIGATWQESWTLNSEHASLVNFDSMWPRLVWYNVRHYVTRVEYEYDGDGLH